MSVSLRVMMRKTERLSETLAFRVSAAVYDLTVSIADKERRDLSDVERAVYERGLAAYQRDGKLFEPEETVGTNAVSERKISQPERINVKVREGRRRAIKVRKVK